MITVNLLLLIKKKEKKNANYNFILGFLVSEALVVLHLFFGNGFIWNEDLLIWVFSICVSLG